MQGLTDVGALNCAFAEDFLRREGIRHVGGSLGGRRGRRLQYWPVCGRARQILLGVEEAGRIEAAAKTSPARADAGALELF
jgi:chemotaxis protein CheD